MDYLILASLGQGPKHAAGLYAEDSTYAVSSISAVW
jgi:hypothetical protein